MALKYPDTRTVDAQDTLAGISFADPYRWLEGDTDEVREWQRAQARLAVSYVREWPHFERLKSLVAHFYAERRVALPRYAAGQWFRLCVAQGASQAHVVVAGEPLGEGRILFDPINENTERPPFVSWISPSPDGRTLAFGVCTDGSESNTIRLIDVASGRLLADPPPQMLMDNWTGGVQWLPDSTGFFFTSITGPATDFEQCVYLHRRGAVPTTIPINIKWTSSKEYRMVAVSRDGRYAVALERMNNVIPVAVAALGAGSLEWRPFVTSVAGTLAGHIIGDNYVAVTNVRAPRGRLVAIPLDATNPNDPDTWRILAGESDAVLRTVTPVGNDLYLTEFVDTYARVRILNSVGELLGNLPLPGCGAISEMPFPFGNLLPQGHPNKFIFAFSSLVASWGIYSHTPGEKIIETLRAPQVALEDAVVEEHHAVSKDGTHIPYHLVRSSRTSINKPQPTLIYAYGGFNVAHVPQFPGMLAAFVATGGVLIHAHLRGGGEFGFDWWEKGRFANKQNCYDDLYAVAEQLIENQRCTPQTLAVTGRSNGGLMAGVAITQRPDLWAVGVPCIPRLDLIGACRTSYGRRSTLEDRITNLQDPDQVNRLATYSPYHLVRDGVRYPAIFIDAGDTDPRCPPQDARKFIARLQATGSMAPILLHVWENVGHGVATDKTTTIDECTEWLAFIFRSMPTEANLPLI